MNDNRGHNLAITGIAICFVIWAAIFIYRSSFVASDGRRYFSLFDDAMISMRYAYNLSHGMGLVWNPGERVEGYTNLLMVLLMSLSNLIFDKRIAVLAVQISGIVFLLGNAYLTMLIADQVSLDESPQHRMLLRVLAFLCTLSYYPLVYWSLMGMETGLLTSLLLPGILVALKHANEQNTARLFLLPISLGLAYLTRPDSAIPSSLVLIYFIYESCQSRASRLSLTLILGLVGLYLLFPVGQAVFRWQYYGELVPNTYTLKLAGIPLLHRIKNGFNFVKPFLRANVIITLVVVAGLFFNFRKQKRLLLTIAMAAICYQIWVGGDPWLYWRMLSPAMPLVLLLFVHEILLIVDYAADIAIFERYFLRNPILSRQHVPVFLVLSLTLTVHILRANAGFISEMTLLQKPYTTGALNSQINVAIALAHLTTTDATVGVFWAGTIPYYTGRVAMDFLGKSDKHIARMAPDLSQPTWAGMKGVPGHNKYDLDYSIKALQPTYLQNFRWGRQDLSDWVKSQYIDVEYKGKHLLLLKESGAVLWGEIDNAN
jgi:hypothetical protein